MKYTQENTIINVLGKNIEIPLPRIYFGHQIPKEFSLVIFMDNSNCTDGYELWNMEKKDQRRHLTMAELSEILSCKTEETEIISAGLFFASRRDKNIMTCDGIRREGHELLVFNNIDHGVETIYCSYDTTIGYKVKKEPEKRFNMERLFRKYIANDTKSMTVPLKVIDKSNPDLVDYLFQKEYEELPELIQKGDFSFPYDYLQEENRNWEGYKSNVWPLSIELIANEKKEKYIFDLIKFSTEKADITPHYWSQLNLLVKDVDKKINEEVNK